MEDQRKRRTEASSGVQGWRGRMTEASRGFGLCLCLDIKG